MHFTAEQQAAIDIARLGEDACIVAGPGSGKTTVLVERYRKLVESGVQPAEILAITFTEKAAANMRQRLAAEFAGDSEMLRKLERAQVSTIHGFCSRLLKENATAAGIDPEFEILDEQLAVLEQTKALRLALDHAFQTEPERAASLLEATTGADLERLLPPIYDAVRAAGLRPDALREMPPPKAPSLELILAAGQRYLLGFPSVMSGPQRKARDKAFEWVERVRGARSAAGLAESLAEKPFTLNVTNSAKLAAKQANEEVELLFGAVLEERFAEQKDLLISIFEEFDANYRRSKAALAALDFNDLEYFAVGVLEENPEIRQQVNDHYRLVMIDEFQDTSKQQSELVRLIRVPGRFYAVGDLNQSIYSFRHASPAVFNEYRQSVEDSKAHAQELVENWRSREPILLATQVILNKAEGIEERKLVPARKLPPREEPQIEVLAAEQQDDEAEDARALEAKWVVNRILALRETLRLGDDERPARLSDFALLLRKMTIVQPFLHALEDAGLDYNLNRRSGFFETREARDLLHLLRMIQNPRDEVSTLVILRSAFAGISDEGLLRMKLDRSSFADAFISRAPLDPEDQSRLDRFLAAFNGWRSSAAHLPVDRLVLRALDESGIVWDAGSAAGANIEKFLSIARSYSHMTLGEFLLHVDAMRKADPRETDAPIDETRDAVQIMTTHAAKGLEFPIVILAAMDSGVDFERECMNFTPEFGLGVKWGKSGFVHQSNAKQIEQTEKHEANRLLYVAMTRAEEHLVLAWSQKVGKTPKVWAKTVTDALQLETKLTGVHRYAGPDNKEFEVRFLRTAEPPELVSGPGSSRTASDALVIAPPVIREQYEQNATASALSQFASCPRKYYLGNYLGWRGDLVRSRVAGSRPDSTLRASDIGTEVHHLLADVPVAQPDLESIRLARVFESSAYGKRSAKARTRETEWDFVFAFEDLIVRGTVDLWFEDAQGLTLIDYKTDDVTVAQAADRGLDYALQIQIYALALSRALGKLPDHALLHFLRPDVPLPMLVADAAANVSRVAREFTRAQEQMAFPLNIGSHCRRCEFFRNICPAKLPNED